MFRCYLGGATNLRGFVQNSVGATAEHQPDCYMGGMASWAAAVHAYKSVLPVNLLYLHAFAVAGNIYPVEHGAIINDVLNKLLNRPRGTIGLGLAIRLGQLARVELNYCHPIAFHATDNVRPGVHFGIGVDFL